MDFTHFLFGQPETDSKWARQLQLYGNEVNWCMFAGVLPKFYRLYLFEQINLSESYIAVSSSPSPRDQQIHLTLRCRPSLDACFNAIQKYAPDEV